MKQARHCAVVGAFVNELRQLRAGDTACVITLVYGRSCSLSAHVKGAYLPGAELEGLLPAGYWLADVMHFSVPCVGELGADEFLETGNLNAKAEKPLKRNSYPLVWYLHQLPFLVSSDSAVNIAGTRDLSAGCRMANSAKIWKIRAINSF